MRSLLPRAAALLALATAAIAQGVVDQQNDPSGGSGFGCGSPPILNQSIRQGFVPTVDNLIAVELRLQAGSAFPAGGTTVTARILVPGTPPTELGVTTASVAGPLAQNTQVLVRFDFAQISLTAGSTYLIEWVTPPTTTLTWVGKGGDPYPAGTAHSCSGNVWPVAGTDFNFLTYYAVPPPPPPEEPPAEEPPAEEPPAEEPPAEEPPTCASLLDDLRAAVADLELSKFKRCVLGRLLDGAERALELEKPKTASTLVHALECQIRILWKIGLVSEEEAEAILDLAAEFRTCLGVAPKTYSWGSWTSMWDRHHRR